MQHFKVWEGRKDMPKISSVFFWNRQNNKFVLHWFAVDKIIENLLKIFVTDKWTDGY